MTLFQTELELLGLAFALYLYDSAVLLYANEGVLVRSLTAKWRVQFAFDNTNVAGRSIYLPNPFTPYQPVFKLAWNFDGAIAASKADWESHAGRFTTLSIIVIVAGVSLFVLLPLGLFFKYRYLLLILALVLLYSSLAAIGVWLYLNRTALQLSRRELGFFIFECLACPPFALNIVRKLGLRVPVREDLIGAVRRLVAPAHWPACRGRLIERLDEQISGEDEGSARAVALEARKRELLLMP